MPVVLTTEKNGVFQAYVVWKTDEGVKYAQCGPVGEVIKCLDDSIATHPDDVSNNPDTFSWILKDVASRMSSEEFADQIGLQVEPPRNITTVHRVKRFLEDPNQIRLWDYGYPFPDISLPDDIPPELYPEPPERENGNSEPTQITREREKDYSQRLAWDRGHDAYTTKVKEIYNHECAVCGLKVEVPEGDAGGNYEVEAAHIQRAADGGPDKLPNRVTLCRLHHWAFDTGWFSLSDEHHIIVKDATDRAGYEEFRHLDGQVIRLPEDPEVRPHPHFLRIHREEHGFENAD